MWKWFRFFGIIKALIKKYYDNKVLNFALDEGYKTWVKVDLKFNGKLDKDNYKEGGVWVEGGEAAYDQEKWDRRRMWSSLLKKILIIAYPQYSGYTALLDIVLGRLGMEARKD